MAFEVPSDLDPATEAALHTRKKGKHSQALWYTVTSDLWDGALPMIQLELLSFLVYRPLWLPRWGHRWGLVPTWPWNLTGFIICRLSLFSLLCKSSFCKKTPSGWAHLQGILMTHERSFWFAFYEEIRSTLLIPRRRKRNRSLWTCRADGREADYTTWWRNSCGCFDSFPLFFFFFSYFPPWRLVTIGIHFNRMSSSCCSLAVRKTNEQLSFRADRRWECEHVHRPITAPELQGAAHPPSASEETVCCR